MPGAQNAGTFVGGENAAGRLSAGPAQTTGPPPSRYFSPTPDRLDALSVVRRRANTTTAMKPYGSFIICATSRSGSTLLCKLLTATGVAGKPESYFHLPSVSGWAIDYDVPSREADTKQQVMRAILAQVRQQGSNGTNVFGLRLMRKSFDYLMEQLDGLFPCLPSDAARFERAFGRTLYIHLSRDDKIAQAVSVVKAMQTGLWHIAPDGTELERAAPSRQPVYDADHIEREIAELTAYDADWEHWFKKERLQPLRVTYQELADNPSAILARILHSLGLDSDAADNVRPGVGKLADATSRDWVKRYQAER